MSRVMQSIVAGVGFLGAGTILEATAEGEVHGLITAAGNWLDAAIGVAVGLGREAAAVLSALLALGVLSLVPMMQATVPPKTTSGNGEAITQHANGNEDEETGTRSAAAGDTAGDTTDAR